MFYFVYLFVLILDHRIPHSFSLLLGDSKSLFGSVLLIKFVTAHNHTHTHTVPSIHIVPFAVPLSSLSSLRGVTCLSASLTLCSRCVTHWNVIEKMLRHHQIDWIEWGIQMREDESHYDIKLASKTSQTHLSSLINSSQSAFSSDAHPSPSSKQVNIH